MCVTVGLPNFVAIDQTVPEIWRFIDFSKWGPSTIFDLFRAWVFGGLITVQNLAGIDAGVSTIWKF